MTQDMVLWVSALWAMDTPQLPTAGAMQVGLCLGWGTVLAWVTTLLTRPWPTAWRGVVAGLMFAWCWLPGVYSPTHWLGLAFQSPSLGAVLLCAVLAFAGLVSAPRRRGMFAPYGVSPSGGYRVLAGLGVLLGWLLLLDTMALLPWELYRWGFSPLAVALAMLVALLPWVWAAPARAGAVLWVAPLSVLMFVGLRLPTGNVWDALLDPWLWGALHVYWLRSFWRGQHGGRS